eukprot:520557-Rhodomonas_salina.1
MGVTRACEDVQAAASMNDVVEVDLDVGMVGMAADWNRSVTSFRDVLSATTTGSYVDTALTVQATSMQAGLITIAVRGKESLFTSPQARAFHVEIEDMVTLHFLEATQYAAMLALLQAGGAFALVRHEGTGYLEIALTAAAIAVCGTETIPGDFTCAARRNIYRRDTVSAHAAHSLATGVGTSDEDATVEWLQEHILRGRTEFTDALARNFTRLSRAAHSVNDRYNKAWFVNPMYAWTSDENAGAQSILSMTDRTIVLAVIALDDGTYAFGSGGGVGRRRSLLQVSADGTGVRQNVRSVAEHPVSRA